MRFRRETENDDGWSDWMLPKMSGYKMACCDCGLVHVLEFGVLKVNGMFVTPQSKRGYIVQFRAQRNNRSTAQMRRHMSQKANK